MCRDCGISSHVPLAVALGQLAAGAAIPEMCRQCGVISHSSLSAAVEQAADSIVITDHQGKIQFVNPAFTNMTGYSSAEVLGKNPRILSSGLESLELYQRLWRKILSGQNWQGELRNRRKDGSVYCEEMHVTPVKGESGEIVNFIAIKRDVTERRAADDAHRFLVSMIENSEDSMVACSSEGIILAWNRGAGELFGYSADEVIGKPMSMLLPVERAKNLKQFIATAMRGLSISQYEGVCKPKIGNHVPVSVTGGPIRNSEGKIAAVSIVMRDITGRKLAAEALRESEGRFRIMADGCPTMMWVTDANGELQFINRAYREFCGVSYEEVQGLNWRLVLHPEDATQELEAFGRAVRERKRHNTELRIRRADGEWRWVNSRAEPRLSPKGEYLGHVGISPDITERKQAEESIRNSQLFAQATIDALSSHICVLDENGVIIAANRAWKEFAEANRSVSIKEPVSELQGNYFGEGVNYLSVCDATEGAETSDAVAVAAGIRGVLRGECDQFSAEYACHSPEEQRWFLCGVTKFTGHSLPRVVVEHINISERKIAEQALLSSEQKFQQLAENIREVIWVVPKLEGEKPYVSPAYEEVWGRTCDSFRENPNAWVEFVHPEDVEQALHIFSPEVEGKPAESEFRIVTPDGQVKWIRDRAFPVFNQAGSLVRVVGISEEITERKRYEEELIHARVGADAANRAKSRFLANMSHEIRTPMNGVIGMIQLMLQTSLTEEQRHYADVAQSSGRMLLTLIDDILDISKIEAGKITLEMRGFDLREMVAEVSQLLLVQACESGLRITPRVSPEIPILCGDAHRLRQILNNLASNAVKFTERGEVKLDVELVGQENGKATVHFAVSDTGIGISPERVARLFSPFTQADASTTRKFGGTGLGLAICKQLVEMMGGEIGLKSQEGQGSTFSFTLTFETVSSTPTLDSSSSVALATPTGRVGRYDAVEGHEARILIAEDNPTNRAVALAQLGKLGYEAIVVANGAEAVKAVEAGRYDLVLMDCEMPVMDGYEATRSIRRSGNLQLPIVAVTAHAATLDRERCIEAGMNDFISKPVNLDRIAEVIAQWCPKTVPKHEVDPEQESIVEVEIATFNAEALLKRLMGDRSMANVILGGFLTDFPVQLKTLQKQLAEADGAGAHIQAHSLKGAAATVSADKLSAVALEIERASRAGELDHAVELLPKMLAEFKQLERIVLRDGWLKE